MASIFWKIFLLDAIGCICGVFGCSLTLVAYNMDSSWFEYLHNAVFRPDALTLGLSYGLRNLDHFLKTLGQNLKWDGFAFILMAVVTIIALGHLSCGILSVVYRQKLNSRKSINRVIAGSTIIAGLLLLYSMYITDKEFYYYMEIIFYEKNLSNDMTSNLEPPIHWPCNYYSINMSSLVPTEYYGIYSESSLDTPVTGPHTCQYKFYKLSAVVLFFLYSSISQVVIYYINTHLIANLARAPAVADAAMRRLRQEIPFQVLRMQQERNGIERNPLNSQGYNPNPTRMDGNFHIFPVFPSSQTIDSFDLPCFDCPGNCDNFETPPPPYPGNTTETNIITIEGPIVAPENIPTDVVNTVEAAPDYLPNNNVPEQPPPSYSSTLLQEGHKNP